MIEFFTNIQNLFSIGSVVTGVTGFIYGYKKKKYNNFDLIQSLYEDMLKHLKQSMTSLKEENEKLRNELENKK